MNTLQYWFYTKLTNTILEVLSCLVFLLCSALMYMVAAGDDIAQMLAKLAIITTLVYFIMMFVYMHYSLQSIEIDAKEYKDRTDNDKQTQFFVAKLSMAKMLVAGLGLTFLLISIVYGL